MTRKCCEQCRYAGKVIKGTPNVPCAKQGFPVYRYGMHPCYREEAGT
jgi:hypothetical protein